MYSILLFAVGIAEAASLSGLLWRKLSKGSRDLAINQSRLEDELKKKKEVARLLQELRGSLLDFEVLREKVAELKSLRESLRVERGRLTITQAELETVETRLRELEEIERELIASGLETKEELKILKRKEKELTSKNEALKQQLAASMEQLQSLLSEIEMTAQMQVQVDKMKAEMVEVQEKIDKLLSQIEAGNEQYFILKQRYDALDIEYAQLYEKFSESEASKEEK